MTEKIIIAGSGGQGIMLLGKVLAEAAMQENKFVTWLPSYGAEVRGGTAHCMVVISDKEIGSPYIDKADTLIIMNRPSLDKFKDRISASGNIIVNSSLAKGYESKKPRAFSVPFTDIAGSLNNIKVANMVALGFFASCSGIVNLKSIEKTIDKIAPSDKKGLIMVNKMALKKGAALAGETNG